MEAVNQTKKREFVKFSWAETQHNLQEAWKEYKAGKISLQEYRTQISTAHMYARVSNLIRLENRTRGNNLLANTFLEQTK